MSEVRVEIAGRADPLRIRINGPDATFQIGTDRIAAAMVSAPDPILLDLLDIASAIFAADGSISRGGMTRPGMGEGWRRHFDFDIPVRRPDVWARKDVTEALVGSVDFLMEDSVTFRFHGRSATGSEQFWFDFDKGKNAFQADEVILFSGGLDSFAGTLERLETSNDRLVLVTHRSAQKTIPHQVRLAKMLSERYPSRVLHINVPAHRKGHEARETTQRSRSFLFAALAQAVAQMLGCSRISFYENGIVSHNLPLNAQVVGSMATRTTHPRALHLIETLHQRVLPSAALIRNPYVWLTKTEVVQRISQYEGKEAIKLSVSCTHVRDQDTLRTHCADCTQCLDRRFAILAAGLEDDEPAEMYRVDVLTGARDRSLSRTIAVDWTRHARELAGSEFSAFYGRFAQDIARIADGYPGESPGVIARRVFELHKRHGASVVSVLETAFQRHAGELARQRLPATSLLVQHTSAQDPSLAMPMVDPITAITPSPPDLHDHSGASELLSGPSLPLSVEFFMDGGHFGVAIRDVATIRGLQAHVVHVLRKAFERDKSSALAADKHRYVSSGEVCGEVGKSKEIVRQTILRCRKHLQNEWRAITETPLDSQALIQSGKASGYRLKPDIRTSDR